MKQNRFKFLHEEIVNVYIVYKTVNNFNVSSYPTLENCLFGTVKLTKKEHIEKYGYSNYATGFERHWIFSYPSGGTDRNVVIFGVDMSSSIRINNRNKDILFLGKGPSQWLQHKKCIQLILKKNILEWKKI